MEAIKTIVNKVSVPSEKKTKQKEYLPKGTLPIIDQGQLLIGGYTNDTSKTIICDLPVIVFGDHTCCVKYIDFPFGAGADGIKVIKPKEGVLPKYLFYGIQYLVFKLSNRGYGRHYQHIEKMSINVPPISQQERIVSQIEESLSQLDSAVETLKKTKQQLEVYRQAVLKEAFEGKLTDTWRSQNQISDSNYIEKARIERDKLFHKMKLKKLKYEWKDDIALPDIPSEWEYAQIGDVAWSIKDGPHYSPEYSDTGIPFITGGNVRPSGVDFNSAKRISLELHKELSKRCKPEKGDMLYTKGGTTGIARLNTYDIDFNVWVHVAVIKFVDTLHPQYFQHVLNSPLCYQQSQKYTHGVGNQDLGLTRMINIIFPICSLEEQKQVVVELESRLSECDSIEKTVNQSLQQAEALRQSILKKAFSYE